MWNEQGVRSEHGPRITLWSKIFPSGYVNTLVPLMKMAWPLVVTNLFQMTFGTMAVYFAGDLSKYDMDAVFLANSIIAVTGLSFTIGLASACDTLFSQIFGSGDKLLAGVVLQRALIMMILIVIPLWALHINIGELLVAFGQDPIVAKNAGNYILIFIPGFICVSICTTFSRFLQNQNIIYPTMVIGILSNVLNIGLHYLFMTVLQLGIRGSALAVLLSYTSMGLANALYVILSPTCRESWDGWSWAAFKDWGQFAHLALFGFLEIGAQWWSFELAMFLPGFKGVSELGVQAVLFQYKLVFYLFSYGVVLAGSITIGQHLGASDAAAAKTVAHVALSVTGMIGVIFGILSLVLHRQLPLVFTSDNEVIHMSSRAFYIFAVFVLFDAIGGTCSGIMRGSGRQFISSIIVGASNALGLITGSTLMFKTNLSVYGIWIGLTLTMVLITVVTLVYITASSWEHQVHMAQNRVQIVAHSKKNVYRQFAGVTEQNGLLQDENHNLTTAQLLCRRGAVITLCAGVLIGGIIYRICFSTM